MFPFCYYNVAMFPERNKNVLWTLQCCGNRMGMFPICWDGLTTFYLFANYYNCSQVICRCKMLKTWQCFYLLLIEQMGLCKTLQFNVHFIQQGIISWCPVEENYLLTSINRFLFTNSSLLSWINKKQLCEWWHNVRKRFVTNHMCFICPFTGYW